jgi:hypothetical protein
MRTPVKIVRAHQNLWNRSYELWKLPRYRSSEGRTIAYVAPSWRPAPSRSASRCAKDEDDRGEQDDRIAERVDGRFGAALADGLADPRPMSVRSFWLPSDAAQFDDETLRDHLLEQGTLRGWACAARFAGGAWPG